MANSIQNSSQPSASKRRHNKSRSKEDSNQQKKSHKHHHHHHRHQHKDKKKQESLQKQEKMQQKQEKSEGEENSQFATQQALIQAQQSQNQQFMNVNFFDLQHQQFQIVFNNINYILPELQFQYRHARKLYVGNLPDGVTTEQIVEFLWRTLQVAGGLLETGNPIIHSDPFLTQKFIFIELRSIEETDACLQLDGLIYAGRAMRFRRPKDFDKYPIAKGTRAVPQLNLTSLGLCAVPTVVNDGPNKLFIGGIPIDFDEGQIIQLLQLKEFGSLKGFHLVKDPKTNNSKGYAFLEYEETEGANRCIQRLNGLLIMGRNLQCKRADNSNEQKQQKFNSQTNVSDLMQFQNQQYPALNQQYQVLSEIPFNQPSNFNLPNQNQPYLAQQQFGLSTNFVI